MGLTPEERIRINAFWKHTGEYPECHSYEGECVPNKEGQPIDWCITHLKEIEQIPDSLISFFDLSAYWQSMEHDYELIPSPDGRKVQIWRKV